MWKSEARVQSVERRNLYRVRCQGEEAWQLVSAASARTAALLEAMRRLIGQENRLDGVFEVRHNGAWRVQMGGFGQFGQISRVH